MSIIDYKETIIGNAYISKTKEIISFLSILSEMHNKSLEKTTNITTRLGLLEPDYFDKPMTTQTHIQGCVGWYGATGKEEKIGMHGDKYSILVLTIHNKNNNDWNQLPDDEYVIKCIETLKSVRTPRTNGRAYYDHTCWFEYQDGEPIEPPHGLFLKDEYVSDYKNAKEVMPRLRLSDFIIFNSDDEPIYINDHDHDNEYDHRFSSQDRMLIKKPYQSDSDEFMLTKLKPKYHQIVKNVNFQILSIDLPQSTNLLLDLFEYISNK
jgi:hypothetical protein